MSLPQQSAIYYAKQPVRGSIPNGTVFKELETTGGSVAEAITTSTVKSEIIRRDGQATYNIQDKESYNTEFPLEITEDIVDLMSGALRCNTTPILTSAVSSDVVLTASTKKIEATGINFSQFKPNAFVFINGQPFYVTAVESDALTVKGTYAEDIDFGNDTEVSQRIMRSGRKANYYIFQEREDDESAAGNESFTSFTESLINTLSISAGTSGQITATVGIVGGRSFEEKFEEQVDDLAWEPKKPLSNLDVEFYPDQVPMVIDGTATTEFLEMTIEISSNSEAIPGLGRKAAVDNTVNTITVTGSLNSISRSNDPKREISKKNKLERFTMSLAFFFADGKSMVLTLPQLVYTEGSRERGTDTIRQFAGTFDAETKVEIGSTIQVDFSY